ncbi:membrane-associated protein, putative [Bodo saltans]|uniref:Membrane-associated protein, putative n=1 Tax=Bodo saltans TaxID=75058 RepID=A0A0S4J429_BODSA|nr:membrane-associated protein, putative [Bodo saltans]|eukprot:CUG12051.1 membrane-associated protein, putative [Bodo saltans]
MMSCVLRFALCLSMIVCFVNADDTKLTGNSSFFVTLSFVDNSSIPIHNLSCNLYAAGFELSLSQLCVIPSEASITTVPSINETSCTFMVNPNNPDDKGSLIPCFDGVVSSPWSQRLATWQAVTTSMQISANLQVTASVIRVVLGDWNSIQGGELRSQPDGIFAVLFVAIALYGVGIVCWLIDWCLSKQESLFKPACGQCYGSILVACTFSLGIAIYFIETAVVELPYIPAGSTTNVENCYVNLQDFVPWDPSILTDGISTYSNFQSDAGLKHSGNNSQVIYQWPCKTHVFYNPYDVIFGSNGERVPLTFVLTSSTLVAQTFRNATNVPIVVRTTASQLAANRAYFLNASFFSIDVSLVSGIAYIENTATDASQAIQLNATSVFVVAGEAENLKSVGVTHLSNPPLFCIGPKVDVTFNASSCSSGVAGAAASGGGNETYAGLRGYCTLEARDPSSNISISRQRMVVRTLSFYMLPLAPAPISGKYIGSGFESPPGLSDNVLIAINTSQTWVSAFTYDSYVQNIDIVTPLLGIKMLNTNFPAILQFFPELIKWLTAFVLNPPYRTIQAVPDHFTCDDDMTIENLIPPATTLIMYLDGANLANNADERFASKVLPSVFDDVNQNSIPGSLTSYQLPIEAWEILPLVRRHTFVNAQSVVIARPPIADLLISVSVILAVFLIIGLGVLLFKFGGKIFDFLAMTEKQAYVESVLSPKRSLGADTLKINSPDQSEPPAAKRFLNRSPLRFFSELVSDLSRALNGLSYRITLTAINFLRLWSHKDEAFEAFLERYIHFDFVRDERSSISLENFIEMYQIFCRVFDRPNGEEYKKITALCSGIDRVAARISLKQFEDSCVGVPEAEWAATRKKNWQEHLDRLQSKKFLVQSGEIYYLSPKYHGDDGKSEYKKSDEKKLLNVHISRVKQMMSANCLNPAFAASRTWPAFRWYDRALQHPFVLGGMHNYYYCLLQLIPIAFSIFCLFTLQLAMIDYQITGVAYRNTDTAAGFIISSLSIGELTVQMVLLLIFYACAVLLLLERFIHSLGGASNAEKTNSDMVANWIRLLLFLPFVASTLFMCGYIFLVTLWWVLTCFLAPNVMIPFAASALSLASSLYGVYRSLKGCKQKLIDYIEDKIKTEVNRFLQSLRFDEADLVVDQVANYDDFSSNAKLIASTSKIPLPVVEFSLRPRDEQVRRSLIQFFAPQASPEFQALLTFSCGITTDVDDIAPLVKPFIDELLPPPQRSDDDGVATSPSATNLIDAAKLTEAHRDLVFSLIRSLILPHADDHYLHSATIYHSLARSWKYEMLSRIENFALAADPHGNPDVSKTARLGALRQLVISVDEFLSTRQLRHFCDRLMKLLPVLLVSPSTHENNEIPLKEIVEMTASFNVVLPIVGKLSWIFAENIGAFEESFNFIQLALPAAGIPNYRTVANKDAQALGDDLSSAQAAVAPQPPVNNPKRGEQQSDSQPKSEKKQEDNEVPLLEINTDGNHEETKATTPTRVHGCWRCDMPENPLYFALTAVANHELEWSIPKLQQFAATSNNNQQGVFQISQLIMSDISKKDENALLLSQWVTSLRRGLAWPTLDLVALFPKLSENEGCAALKNFSLAGINPGSFLRLTGWQSCASQRIIQREARCLATWIREISSHPSTFKFAAEAYFYDVVSQYLTPKGTSNVLLMECLKVSCPHLAIAMKTIQCGQPEITDLFDKKILNSPLDNFSQLAKRFSKCFVPSEVPPQNWLERCRFDCSPIFVLTVKDTQESLKAPATADGIASALDELRQYTGLRIGFGSDGTMKEDDLSTFESVCAVATMQLHASEDALQAVTDMACIVTSGKAPDALTEAKSSYMHKDFVRSPMCGIGLGLEDRDELKNEIIVASAMLKVPLYAFAAVVEACDENTDATDDTNAELLSKKLIGSILDPDKHQDPSYTPKQLQNVFSYLPNVVSGIMKKVDDPEDEEPLKTVKAHATVANRLVLLSTILDITGRETLQSQLEQSKRYGVFVPQGYEAAASLLKMVLGDAAVNDSAVTLLRLLLAVAAKDGELDDAAAADATAALCKVSTLIYDSCGIELLPPQFRDAASFFATKGDGDFFGLLNSCMMPLLPRLSSLPLSKEPPWLTFALTRVAYLHKYKRRPAAMLEIFREYCSEHEFSLSQQNSMFAVPATPVEGWLCALQKYSTDLQITELQTACAAAVGSQFTAAGWTVLQRHVELQKSSGKRRDLAIESTFKATLGMISAQRRELMLKQLKKLSLFDGCEDLAKSQTTIDHFRDDLVKRIEQNIVTALHISHSDMVRIVVYAGVVLSFFVVFILLGIVAFSNGSTFSSLVGVALPLAGGSATQYDTPAFLEELKERADKIFDEFSSGFVVQQPREAKQKQD